jgi:aldose 1-epimerase
MILEAGRARVEVDVAVEGRLSSLCVDGLELLVREDDAEAESALHWGCYPMAPWCSRVRDGVFEFAGRGYSLPLRMPPHAIHGTVLDRGWTLESSDSTRCQLSIGLGPDWPFAGHARQSLALSEDALECTLEVHASETPFPASIGWHPWLRRRLATGATAQLDFEAASIYVLDASGLPTGETRAPGPGPYDDCFKNLSRDPVLRWADALELTFSSSLDHWVVYDALPHAVCVEPSSGPPDALNIAQRIVTPGAPLVGRFRIAWS